MAEASVCAALRAVPRAPVPRCRPHGLTGPAAATVDGCDERHSVTGTGQFLFVCWYQRYHGAEYDSMTV